MKCIRTIIQTLCFIFCLQSVQAQISGVIPGLKSAAFIENKEGVKVPLKEDMEGRFHVNIKQLKKGFYTITTIGDVYLEPYYSLQVSKVKDDYLFRGKGEVENNLIQEMNRPFQKLESNNGYGLLFSILLTEPDKLVPILDDYEKQADRMLGKSKNVFFKTIKTQDMAFLKRGILNNYMRFYGLDSTKMDSLKKYLSIPLANRTKDHQQKLYQAYLTQFSKKFTEEERTKLNELTYLNWDPNDELLFKNSADYRIAISNRLNFLTYAKDQSKLRDSLKSDEKVKLLMIKKQITNPYINDYFTAETMVMLIKKAAGVSEIEEVYKEFMERPRSAKSKADVLLVYHHLKETEKNAIAPDFSYLNGNGNSITLKGMKGKYVYIDLWATWCAPCIAELPDLKKVQQLFSGKNINFVSISVDEIKNKQAWLNFLKGNDLSGIQLIADRAFDSDFVKKFGVTSIPRFILIGPDGKVIDNNAKRPSNPALTTQLKALLEGK